MISNRPTTVLLDPTGEHQVSERKKAPRPKSLDGLTVGLLDIGKPRGDVFLNKLDTLLAAEGIAVKRYAKPTPSRLATLETRQKMAGEVDAVVIGLAD
jgi:hypothetical protein